MSVSIHSSGYAALAAWETLTLSATSEGVRLDQDIRNLYDKFEPRWPTLNNLWERVDDLLTWGSDWPEYKATPPMATTVDRAHRWITDLYNEVLDGGRTWDDPLITANDQGEATFEWQQEQRRLTIYVTETETNYSKTWGTPPDFAFEDGIAETLESREELWFWLLGS